MIHKVDGNGYYDYTKPKKVDIPNTGEKFSLGYQKDELPSDLKEKKEKEVSDQEKQQAAERNGVRIELSSKGVEKQKQAEAMKSSNVSGLTAWLETIRTFLTTTVAAVKDIFSKIWNDPPPDDAVQDISETIETAESLESVEAADALKTIETAEVSENTEIASAIRVTEIIDPTDHSDTAEDAVVPQIEGEKQDREIRRHLQNGDMNQVIRLLTDNGRKTVARNSTLLTYYDRNGRVVELDASVKERTLHGDRNTQKL